MQAPSSHPDFQTVIEILRFAPQDSLVMGTGSQAEWQLHYRTTSCCTVARS